MPNSNAPASSSLEPLTLPNQEISRERNFFFDSSGLSSHETLTAENTFDVEYLTSSQNEETEFSDLLSLSNNSILFEHEEASHDPMNDNPIQSSLNLETALLQEDEAVRLETTLELNVDQDTNGVALGARYINRPLTDELAFFAGVDHTLDENVHLMVEGSISNPHSEESELQRSAAARFGNDSINVEVGVEDTSTQTPKFHGSLNYDKTLLTLEGRSSDDFLVSLEQGVSGETTLYGRYEESEEAWNVQFGLTDFF